MSTAVENKASWADDWTAYLASRRDAETRKKDAQRLQKEIPKELVDQLMAAYFHIISGKANNQEIVPVCDIPESDLQLNGDNWELKPASKYVSLMAFAQTCDAWEVITMQKQGQDSFDARTGRRTAKNHCLALKCVPSASSVARVHDRDSIMKI